MQKTGSRFLIFQDGWPGGDTGGASPVVRDDNCVHDADPNACPQADVPLTAADVMQGPDSGLFACQTGYLNPETCTVALLCQDAAACA